MKHVRLWFSKTGLAVFTSHLDTQRVFTRALREAGADIWYTEGFNPRPYMSFPYPLPLGVAALREPLDLKLNDSSASDPDAAKKTADAVGRCLPEGFEIVGYENDPEDLTVTGAEYVFMTDAGEKELGRILSEEKLSAEKSAKSGGKKVIKTVELTPCLTDRTVSDAPGGSRLDISLPCGAVNVSPALLIDALRGFGVRTLSVVRTRIF